jgi:2-oxoglutarate dehydrogenase E2 component (dihydrolipoamide succinyltransferase)
MAFSVQMPALGESVTEGTVTRWLKHEGEQVAVDEPLLEVSTDKVDTEIPSPAAGVLSRIVVGEDETVEVGAELAVISESGEKADDSAARPDEGRPRHAQPSDEAADQPQEEPQEEPLDELEPAQAEAPSTEQEQPAARWEEPAARPTADTGRERDGGGTPVTMPALGESVTEGTVTRWLKQVGESVKVDEPLLEVSTDKVDTEIPSPVAGTVLEINVGEDETVQVGAQLAMIGSGAAAPAPSRPDQQRPAEEATETDQQAPSQEAPSQEAPSEGPPTSEQAARAQAPPQPAPTRPAPAEQAPAQPAAVQPTWAPAAQLTDGQAAAAPYVTPLVRKLAAEHDVDLSSIKGTGVGGRIRKQDVLAAAEAAKAQPEPEPEPEPEPVAPAAPSRAAPAAASPTSALRGRTEKMSRLRQVIAKRMVESLQTSAQLTTVAEVDVTRIARLRDRAKRDFEAREGVRLTFLPFFAKAAVEALKQHPKLNASINSETNEVTYHGSEHLAIAVDTERGLLVPVIHDAGDLSISGLAKRIADLAERTRHNNVTPDELGGGTFTLTNTGSRGALFDTPIINQPQVAILGTGAVVKRPVVTGGEDGDTLAIRSMMFLALSYDHRLVDGADAARFLVTIKERLEEGNFESDL